MLRAKKLTGSGGVANLVRYYDPDGPDRSPERALDEYYTGDRGDEGVVRWWSPASIMVQDGAAVQPGEMAQAMKAQDAHGRLLIKSQPDRTPAWDLTLSAPKSVSVAYALAGPDQRRQISADMLDAARATFQELHAKGAFVTRRGKGSKIHEPAKGVMIALKLDVTSRSADPQLHIHAIMPNIALRQDGRHGAIHSRPFFQQNRNSGVTIRFLQHLARSTAGRFFSKTATAA